MKKAPLFIIYFWIYVFCVPLYTMVLTRKDGIINIHSANKELKNYIQFCNKFNRSTGPYCFCGGSANSQILDDIDKTLICCIHLPTEMVSLDQLPQLTGEVEIASTGDSPPESTEIRKSIRYEVTCLHVLY